MALFFYETMIGRIGIEEKDGFITHLYFKGDNLEREDFIYEAEVIKRAFAELTEYFEGKRKEFTTPIKYKASPFIASVLEVVKRVPYGKTATYKEIAMEIGSPKACRAVGMANNRNPLPIFIPCHRIIGSNKALVGYAGGIDIKEKLLKIESNNKI